MMWLFFLIPMLFLPASPECIEAVNLNFEIIYKGRVIGNLKAQSVVSGRQTIFTSFTQTNIQVVREMEVLHEFRVVFQNGLLEQSEALVTVNGKPRDHTTIQRKENAYHVIQDEKAVRVFKDHVDYAIIQLLFTEPKGLSRVFSEQEGLWHNLINEGTNSYYKINSKGQRNCYYYQKGKLISAEIDGGLIQFKLKPK